MGAVLSCPPLLPAIAQSEADILTAAANADLALTPTAATTTPPATLSGPDVEIDGSVLEHLGKMYPSPMDPPPLQLVPPHDPAPHADTQATARPVLIAPSLTDPVAVDSTADAGLIEREALAEPSAPPQPEKRAASIQPIIREIPPPGEQMAIPVAPVILAAEKTDDKKPVILRSAALPPLPARKPSPPVQDDIVVEQVATDIPAHPAPTLADASDDAADKDMTISSETLHTLVADIITETPAPTAQQLADIAPAAGDPVAKEIPDESDALPPLAAEIMPPAEKIVADIDAKNITPPEKGLFAWFPIRMKTRHNETLDPAPAEPAAASSLPVLAPPVAVAPRTPAAVDAAALPPPEILPQPESEAEIASESPAPDAKTWRQENPQVIISKAPLPGRRPAIQVASEEFVQQARRTVLETYTVMRNDGSPMPAVAQQDVAREKLPPPRMSVADLADDPLASRILDMSPEEVAAAMNQIAPAGGRFIAREINAVAKPRIVRQEGERIYKSRQNKNLEPVSDVAATPAPVANETVSSKPAQSGDSRQALAPPAALADGGTLAIGFAGGSVVLSDDGMTRIDSTLIPALTAREGSRIQIVAFASPTDGKESSARRTALSRALAVRTYLINKGIDPTRLDVRALGIQTDPGAEKDKVDLRLMPAHRG